MSLQENADGIIALSDLVAGGLKWLAVNNNLVPGNANQEGLRMVASAAMGRNLAQRTSVSMVENQLPVREKYVMVSAVCGVGRALQGSNMKDSIMRGLESGLVSWVADFGLNLAKVADYKLI